MSKSAFSNSNLILLAITYLFYFGQFGVLMPYLGVFLDGRGFTSSEIGELFALITVARIAGPNLWAILADKSGRALKVLQLGALLTFGTFCLVFFVDGFWALTLSLGLMMMFWTAILPQIEGLTLNCVQGHAGRYGGIRLWGSIGYILLTIFTGKMIDVFSSEAPIYVGAIVLFSLFAVTLFLKQPPRAKNTDHQSSIWHKINTPVFYAFLLSTALLQLSFGAYYGFFALYLLDLGYSGQATGWLIALGVLAEVIIFLQAGKLIILFGVKWILVLSILLTALRWYLLAVAANNPAILVVSQVLHAFSFGMTHAASMHFIHHYFGNKFQSQGQAIYISVGFGVGGAIGGYGAGYFWQQGQGAELTFILAAIAAVLSATSLVFVSSKRM
ncbi:MAG: PPP family 3-phenylpropionic acid transporter [Flavobacteriales bacterium]